MEQALCKDIKISVSIGTLQELYGEKEALKIAKNAGLTLEKKAAKPAAAKTTAAKATAKKPAAKTTAKKAAAKTTAPKAKAAKK